MTFHLHDIASTNNTADGAIIGHDTFTNIEGIESGAGNDTFYLHNAENWYIDGGDGIDTVVFVGDLHIGDDTDGPDIVGIEIIDLNTTHNNTVDIDGTGAIEAIYGFEHEGDGDTNDTGNLTIDGGLDGNGLRDRVNLINEYGEGEWQLVSTGPVYTLYVFDDGDNEAQVFIHKDIIVDIIENVTINVATAGRIRSRLRAALRRHGRQRGRPKLADETQFTAYNEESGLTFVVTGTGLIYDIDGDEHFQIIGGFITGIKILDSETEDLLVEATGFNFDAAQFNAALNAYRNSGFTDTSGLDAIFENVIVRLHRQ